MENACYGFEAAGSRAHDIAGNSAPNTCSLSKSIQTFTPPKIQKDTIKNIISIIEKVFELEI